MVVCTAGWMCRWPLSICYNHVRFTSDHSLLIFYIANSTCSIPISLRFLNVWSSHIYFMYVVKEVWQSVLFSCNRMQTIMNKLKATKNKLV